MFADVIKNSHVVAVLVVDEVTSAVPLAKTLLENGVGCMELTLRTPCAVEALRVIRQEVPEMIAGVGTILTRNQVRAVKNADAAFGVAPGLNRKVLEEAERLELPFAPGIATPSEIETALEHGCRTMKFFPAQSLGGLAYLQCMAAPYQHLDLKFIPLGGLSEATLQSWLESPLVCAVGGSWIAPQKLIQEKNWTEIGARAAAAVAIANEIKKES